MGHFSAVGDHPSALPSSRVTHGMAIWLKYKLHTGASTLRFQKATLEQHSSNSQRLLKPLPWDSSRYSWPSASTSPAPFSALLGPSSSAPGRLLLHPRYDTTAIPPNSAANPGLESAWHCPVTHVAGMPDRHTWSDPAQSKWSLFEGHGTSFIVDLFISVRQARLAGNRCSQSKINSTGSHNRDKNWFFISVQQKNQKCNSVLLEAFTSPQKCGDTPFF